MFSSRLHWDLQPNPIAEATARLRRAGRPILDLTESNPTQAGIPYPADEIAAAFADPAVAHYDPRPAGMLAAREAVSAHYGDLHPDRVFLTASTSEAYAYLFKLLTDPGDEVLVPRPSYPLFEFLAGMELARVVQYPLRYQGGGSEGGWEIDFDALRRLATPRTRAIVLVNPNNPTGSFLKRHELGPLLDICQTHGLAILSDEVFSDYVLNAGPDRIGSLRQVDQVLTFCLSGLSKIAGLPQMKLGWILVNGPPKPRAEALARLELIADTYLSVGTPVQVAAPKLFRIGARIRADISGRTKRNLAALTAIQANGSPLRCLHVEGGWCATLQVPRVRPEEEWVLELLRQSNVLTQPGFFYDFESEAFLIVSLLTGIETFDAGIERIGAICLRA